jgi:hypothetical protein
VQIVTVLCLAFVLQAKPEVKPAKFEYDPKRDVTVCSTGDVRTAGYTGYGANFEFPGKTFSMPKSISIGFGALRLTHGRSPDHDNEVLHWSRVDTITLTFGSQPLQLPAKQTYNVSKNQLVVTFMGRALEESLTTTLTPAQLKQIATSDELDVQLDTDKQEIKGKSLLPLKRLAAALPSL